MGLVSARRTPLSTTRVTVPVRGHVCGVRPRWDSEWGVDVVVSEPRMPAIDSRELLRATRPCCKQTAVALPAVSGAG